jgi:hypothetical protein
MNIKRFYDSSDSYCINLRAKSTLTANRIITFPDASGEVSLVGGTETLTNKTLTTPTITVPIIDSIDFTGSASQLIKAGTSGVPLVKDDADTKFIQIYVDCGASSGDNRGIYNRLYLTGTGGGESLRSYTDITGSTIGTAHGCHVSLGFGESTTTGRINGLGAAGRFTLGLANVAYSGAGTLGVVMSEIYSFGSSSDPSSNNIAMFLVGNNGDATGAADVDDDAVLFNFQGWTEGDGNMLAIKAAGAGPQVTHSIRIKTPSGIRYLYAGSDPLTA